MGSIAYSERQRFMSQSNFTSEEFPPLSDVLTAHLNGCETCQASLKQKPIGNLQGNSPLCSKWFGIISDYAQFEGKVNNVVARDEFGNEPKAP